MSRTIGMLVTAALLPLAAGAGVTAAQSCPGDFNLDSAVTTDEILRTVTFALRGCPKPNQRFVDNRDGTITDTRTGLAAGAGVPAGQYCPGDFNGDSAVTTDEIVRAVTIALKGCANPNQRFVDNRDGTITDIMTGLMWEKKVALYYGQENPSNLQDADNGYEWAGICFPGKQLCQPDAASSAACFAGVDGDTSGCDECTGPNGRAECTLHTVEGRPNVTIWQWLTALNEANFGGHSDWRIPTRQELVTIRDVTMKDPAVNAAFHGARCGGCEDVRDPACSCTLSNLYWTSSTYFTEFMTPMAWTVAFVTSNFVPSPRDPRGAYLTRAVRAVRGGP